MNALLQPSLIERSTSKRGVSRATPRFYLRASSQNIESDKNQPALLSRQIKNMFCYGSLTVKELLIPLDGIPQREWNIQI